MAATTIRKTLHTKLVDDFRALVHIGTSTTIFSDVQKFFPEIPITGPTCEILLNTANTEIQGLQFDSRDMGFNFVVRDGLQKATGDQARADEIMDRLSDIEDVMYDYFEQIANPVEGLIPGVTLFLIEPPSTQYIFQDQPDGVAIQMTTSVSFKANIQVNDL